MNTVITAYCHHQVGNKVLLAPGIEGAYSPLCRFASGEVGVVTDITIEREGVQVHVMWPRRKTPFKHLPSELFSQPTYPEAA